ncbi:MAG TPA: family 1 glycosylhydrolase, partial [Acidimicrobiales bacterium]|nr:family 1 glycosylhydrolase [Acidimicrobiales bacterium]
MSSNPKPASARSTARSTASASANESARVAADAGLPDGFLFGVATAGFQIEGGFNGPGQPANNWLAWEQVGRVEPSGEAVGFWEHPEEALDRAATLGCDSFRLGVEWARVVTGPDQVDEKALAGYVDIVRGCVDRGLQPLVTLHHFTHPAWLGDDLWLRPDAPERYRSWVEVAAAALAPWVRHWVTINEINVLATGSWLLGMFPPGRILAVEDASIATDHLLCAHVLGYESIHRLRPDAVVTTNNSCLTAYPYDRLLIDVLLARSSGVERRHVDGWLRDRRRQHDALFPASGVAERVVRGVGAATSTYRPRRAPAGSRGSGPDSLRSRSLPHRAVPHRAVPRRAVDAVYDSPFDRTLDVIGLDWYDPAVGRHFRLPGHRTSGGRSALPTRALWDDVPDPVGLTRWLSAQRSLAPDLPLWVVENGLCNRVRDGHAYPRLDGWDRPRYLREHLTAVMAAVDEGVPVAGYWHWSLVDNYEWGS